jgi:exonuclease SbcD
MRILHTSDWHLGRSFNAVPLLEEQRRFVDQVVEIVSSEGIDLVVVAGDVFDWNVPPAEAVEVWHDALQRIVEAGAQVVAISGNHDQGERIEVPAQLLKPGIVIRGSRSPSRVVLDFADGPLLVAPIPFLNPVLARELHEGEGVVTHQSVVEGWLAATRKAATQAPRSLAVSHAFVRGGDASESERSLNQVGGAELVDAKVYEGFSYAALGHLHRPQVVGDDRVAYCGSPIPYSFSETAEKSVRLVDLGPDGSNLRVELLPVEAGRKVVTLRGTLDELLSDSAHDPYEKADRFFVRAELTDSTRQRDPKNKLEVRFPGVIELNYVGLARDDTAGRVRGAEPGLDPLTLTLRYWDESVGSPPTDAEAALLQAAIQAGFNDAKAPA